MQRSMACGSSGPLQTPPTRKKSNPLSDHIPPSSGLSVLSVIISKRNLSTKAGGLRFGSKGGAGPIAGDTRHGADKTRWQDAFFVTAPGSCRALAVVPRHASGSRSKFHRKTADLRSGAPLFYMACCLKKFTVILDSSRKNPKNCQSLVHIWLHPMKNKYKNF